jgi:hypothetical protein
MVMDWILISKLMVMNLVVNLLNSCVSHMLLKKGDICHFYIQVERNSSNLV